MIRVPNTSAARRSRHGALVWLFARALLVTGCGIALAGGAAPAYAQSASIQREVFVNSEAERYLRVLQVTGHVPLYPWSSRSFSPAEVDSLLPAGRSHPWAARYDLTRRPGDGLRAGLIAPRVEFIYNSAFPYGRNDGAVWAGRGLTTAVHAGGVVRYGPVSLVLAPVAFRAENRPFELASTGQPGPLEYADGTRPTAIDRPQRFGDSSYARIDPGQSTLRLDLPIFALGISTANLHWGPADQQPLLLGNNAPGFAHAFVGTPRPLDIGVGRFQGRLIWGRLEQSAYTVNPDSAAVRFGTGLVAVFQPRAVDGLELGIARFFHMRWGEAEPAKVIESFLKQTFSDPDVNDEGQDEANQLASAFVRWVMPGAGLEVYVEYGREDHNWSFRDAVMQPDHSAGYTVGFRKAWVSAPNRVAVARAEASNSEPSHLARFRRQAPWYGHGGLRQGHTHRGQVLGTSVARGGRGSVLALDSYNPAGRWTVAWTRELRRGGASYDDPDDVRGPDVLHGLSMESVRDVGRVELLAGVAAAWNLNRYRLRDAYNVRLVAGARARH
jgi:hypothetical protein